MALNARHVVTGSQGIGTGGPIFFHRDVDFAELENHIGIAIHVLVSSTLDIHETLSSAALERARIMAVQFKDMVEKHGGQQDS